MPEILVRWKIVATAGIAGQFVRGQFTTADAAWIVASDFKRGQFTTATTARIVASNFITRQFTAADAARIVASNFITRQFTAADAARIVASNFKGEFTTADAARIVAGLQVGGSENRSTQGSQSYKTTHDGAPYKGVKERLYTCMPVGTRNPTRAIELRAISRPIQANMRLVEIERLAVADTRWAVSGSTLAAIWFAVGRGHGKFRPPRRWGPAGCSHGQRIRRRAMADEGEGSSRDAIGKMRNQPSQPIKSTDLTACLTQFELAWQGGAVPQTQDFMPMPGESDDCQPQALVELIRIDLDYRWRRDVCTAPPTEAARSAGAPGQLPDRPRLEDYQACFPLLAPPAEMPLALVGEEYRVRRLWGDSPAADEYQERFPVLGPQLHVHLAGIEAELSAHDVVLGSQQNSLTEQFEHDETPDSSSSLLQRLRQRNSSAWRQFTSIYGPQVYVWCRHFQVNATDSADLAQEVFQAVYVGVLVQRFYTGTLGAAVSSLSPGQIRFFFRSVTLIYSYQHNVARTE